jgi:hypothetical protein
VGVLLSLAIFIGLVAIFLLEPEASVRPLGGLPGFREMMWDLRSPDLLGQMMIILAGTFGVLVLTKERIER